MNNEIQELEILKINHDYIIDKILKKYPYEEGYNVEVISTKSIDARTEKITIKITNILKENNEKIRK